MGLLDKLKKRINNSECIYVPITGEVIALKNIADGVFSEGILGKGVGIIPTEGIVYAPFDGTIIQIADTKHAIGLKSNHGAEVLIHVGLDTVEMKGKGFEQQVKVGDTVKYGQQIMTFSISEIQEAGFPITTAIVITNSDDFSSVEVLGEGTKQKLEKLIQIS